MQNVQYVFEIDVIGDCTLSDFLELIEGFKVQDFKSITEHPTVVLLSDDRQKAVDFLAEYHDSDDDVDWVNSLIREVIVQTV
jgi:hypothetical protein